MRPLVAVLAVQAVIAAVFIALVATENVPFVNYDSDAASAGAAKVNHFNSAPAWRLLREQVELGPRPAGSSASRHLAERLKELLPQGRYQSVPGGLRNVVGSVRGRSKRYVVIGAHYDTKDIPNFVGANDGAGGTAVLVQLARAFARSKTKPRHTLVFVAFDGEEIPGGSNGSESEFLKRGIRGSKVAAKRWRKADAMVLLDFVADKHLSTPREANSNRRLWAKLRAAAKRVGVARHYPSSSYGAVSDDHIPFIRQGVPSIDLIDFSFPCWHQPCDDLSAVSEHSLDVSGEAVRQLIASL